MSLSVQSSLLSSIVSVQQKVIFVSVSVIRTELMTNWPVNNGGVIACRLWPTNLYSARGLWKIWHVKIWKGSSGFTLDAAYYFFVPPDNANVVKSAATLISTSLGWTEQKWRTLMLGQQSQSPAERLQRPWSQHTEHNWFKYLLEPFSSRCSEAWTRAAQRRRKTDCERENLSGPGLFTQ